MWKWKVVSVTRRALTWPAQSHALHLLNLLNHTIFSCLTCSITHSALTWPAQSQDTQLPDLLNHALCLPDPLNHTLCTYLTCSLTRYAVTWPAESRTLLTWPAQSHALHLPDLLNLASVALTQLNYQHANDVEEEEEVQLWADECNTVVAAAAAASRQLKHLYQYYRTYGMHHSLLSQYFDLFCPTSVCILRRICVCVCVCVYTYTGCFTTLEHNCRRWFPRFLWSKKFI